jgi:hypothetical protein
VIQQALAYEGRRFTVEPKQGENEVALDNAASIDTRVPFESKMRSKPCMT